VIALGDFGATGRPRLDVRQAKSLADPVGREVMRIELMLTSGDWSVTRVARMGDQPFPTAPPSL
jgi:hypothetical protein